MYFYNYTVSVDAPDRSKDFEDLKSARKYARELVKSGMSKDDISIFGNAMFEF